MSFEIEMGPPGPEALAVATKELRETEENVQKGLEELRKLLDGERPVFFRSRVFRVASRSYFYIFLRSPIDDCAFASTPRGN